MFALELGGKEYAWNSTVIIGLFTTVVITLIIFFFVERKQPSLLFHSIYLKPLFAASQGVAFSMVPLSLSVQFIFQSSFKASLEVPPLMLD